MSRASSDLQLVQQLLQFMPMLTGNVVLLVLSLFLMLLMSPLLTLLTFLTVPALLIVSLRLRKKMYPAQWDSLQRAGEVAGVVDEAVSGVRVVKGFGQEDREIDTLGEVAEGLYGSRVRNIRIQAKYSSLLAAIPAFGQVGVLALGGYLVIHDEITLGTYLAFATYLAQLLAPVRMMANIIAVAQQTAAAADRIFDILDSNPVVTEKPDAQKLDVDRGEVVVEHVNFGYLRAEPVLADFSMRVAPGETVALVGMSGSGKSTVSLLLPRFYDVQSGIDHDRRRRHHRRDPRLAPPRGRSRLRGRVPVLRFGAEQHRVRAARRHRRRRPARRRRSRVPRSSSRRSPTATTPWSASAGSPCPVASASASPSPVPCSPTRVCSCSTTPRRRSTPAPRS